MLRAPAGAAQFDCRTRPNCDATRREASPALSDPCGPLLKPAPGWPMAPFPRLTWTAFIGERPPGADRWRGPKAPAARRGSLRTAPCLAAPFHTDSDDGPTGRPTCRLSRAADSESARLARTRSGPGPTRPGLACRVSTRVCVSTPLVAQAHRPLASQFPLLPRWCWCRRTGRRQVSSPARVSWVSPPACVSTRSMPPARGPAGG